MTAPPPERPPAPAAPQTGTQAGPQALVPPAAGGGRPWYARPWLVFGALGLVILATLLLSPAQRDGGDRRLTTLSRQPYGARAVADLVERAGWRVDRDSSVPARTALPADRIYAVLAPPEELTGREYGRLLDAVRRGAGLFVVHPGGGALADSTGIDRSRGGARMRVAAAAVQACPSEEPRYVINWPGGEVSSYWLVPKRPLVGDTAQFLAVMRPLTRAERRARGLEVDEDDDDEESETEAALAEASEPTAVEGEAAPPADTGRTRADSVRRARRPVRTPAPAAIGYTLGRGRVVVLADPDWLRNDVVRVCRWHAAVTTVRMLEWIAAGGTPRHVVFDEWHQGRGLHASATAALGTFLVRDPRGRMLAQGVAAALLLLAAVGARPLVPSARGRLERRSPFEHVGALARAYEEIGATRVVARRLVRGLRRRLGTTVGARDEEALLDALQSRHPALAPRIAVVRDALRTPGTPAGLLEVGRAVAEIERTVLKS